MSLSNVIFRPKTVLALSRMDFGEYDMKTGMGSGQFADFAFTFALASAAAFAIAFGVALAVALVIAIDNVVVIVIVVGAVVVSVVVIILFSSYGYYDIVDVIKPFTCRLRLGSHLMLERRKDRLMDLRTD